MIARHEAGRFLAGRAHRPPAIGGSELQARLAQIPEQVPSEASDADAAAELSGLIDRALRVMSRDFREQTWQAFWRTAIEGEPTADVARSLGMTGRAVRQARHRVVRRLRDEFRELIG